MEDTAACASVTCSVSFFMSPGLTAVLRRHPGLLFRGPLAAYDPRVVTNPKRSDPPPSDLDRDEEAVHGVFSVLRDHVVEVTQHFADGIRRRMRQAVRERRKTPRSLMGSVLTETLNVLTGALSPKNGADPERQIDED